MKIIFPGRIVNRHVGGNTTYARQMIAGLNERGIETGTMPMSSHPALTLVRESLVGARSTPNQILHYSADTGPLLPTRTPSVVTVHGVASRWIDVARNPRQEKIWRYRVGRAIASTDRLLTVSQSAADDIAEVFGVDRSRMTVIPHGIDSASFQRETVLSAPVADRLPARYALYLGNVEPRKNLVELVAAFALSPLAQLGLPLVIAGKPAWNFAEIMATIEAAPNVIYLGFVSDDDRVALMQRCTIFLFPSLYEGFGLPVLEAMAAGAPVATSRRGSLTEVAGPSWNIDDLSAHGIAEAVADAVSDESWVAAAPEAGRTWAGTFRWETSVDAHIKVYQDLLS
jgi:glycosyltransferase involved in cell wall biosynthesis